MLLPAAATPEPLNASSRLAPSAHATLIMTSCVQSTRAHHGTERRPRSVFGWTLDVIDHQGHERRKVRYHLQAELSERPDSSTRRSNELLTVFRRGTTAIARAVGQ